MKHERKKKKSELSGKLSDFTVFSVRMEDILLVFVCTPCTKVSDSSRFSGNIALNIGITLFCMVPKLRVFFVESIIKLCGIIARNASHFTASQASPASPD